MNEKLKPCPKCGSPNIIREAFVPEWAVVHWRHKCEDCGHKGAGARTVAWATKLWNGLKEGDGVMEDETAQP